MVKLHHQPVTMVYGQKCSIHGAYKPTWNWRVLTLSMNGQPLFWTHPWPSWPTDVKRDASQTNKFPESDSINIQSTFNQHSINIQSTFNEHSINNTHQKSMKIPQLWTFPARKIHPMPPQLRMSWGGATWAVRIRTHRARNVPASSGWEAAEHAEHAELCPVKVSLRNNDLSLSIP